MVTVEVPATSANLGPGFDCLGLALGLTNRIVVEPLDDPRFEVEVAGAGAGRLPTDGRNLVAVAMRRLFDRVDGAPRGARLRQQNGIPLCSGLGSSAAARVAGLVAANRLCGDPLDQAGLANLATELEGHPDNVLPALVGGLVVAVVESGRTRWVRFDPPPGLHAVVGMPRQALATADARRALPESYSRADVVYNVSRAGFLLAALVSGRFDDLAEAMRDRIHQPYRLPLIPGARDVIAAACEAGAGAAISGAGPSILALCHRAPEAVQLAMREAWANHGVTADVRLLPIAGTGAEVW